mgnify:CR=1 FL=1
MFIVHIVLTLALGAAAAWYAHKSGIGVAGMQKNGTLIAGGLGAFIVAYPLTAIGVYELGGVIYYISAAFFFFKQKTAYEIMKAED